MFLLVHCLLVPNLTLLTNVILHDKVPKAEPYIPYVPPGFEPLVPMPSIIPFNSRLQKPALPGREEEVLELLKMGKGKRPRIGQLPRPLLPRRFYAQLDLGDLKMLASQGHSMLL